MDDERRKLLKALGDQEARLDEWMGDALYESFIRQRDPWLYVHLLNRHGRYDEADRLETELHKNEHTNPT